MSDHFDPEIVRLLSEIEEIEIETVPLNVPELHRVTIWVVVVGMDVYARSVNGTRGRWWQELTTNPIGAIYADNQRIPVHAFPVTDEVTQARVSEAYLRKYHDSEWAPPMVVPEVLPTTLRLEPIVEE